MRNQRCAILCSGLSVRDCDLSKIDVPVIGVNWSYIGRQPDIHVVSNKILIRLYEEVLHELTPHAMARFSWLPARGAYTPQRIMTYANMKPIKAGLKIPRLPEHYNIYRDGWVFAGGGPCALQVALSFDFKDIVFVGLDLCHTDDYHFYSHESRDRLDHSEYSGYSRETLEMAWTVQRSYFEQVIPELIERGVSVRNTGLAEVFPHVSFEEVWPCATR